MRNIIKLLVKGFFGWFGLDVITKNRKVIPPVNTLEHNTEEGLDKYWSDPSNKTLWDAPESHEFYEKIVELLKLHKIDLNGKSIADLGCGNGNLLLYISRHYSLKDCYGYEFSKEALKLAKDIFPEASYSYHNILDPVGKKFDFVFSTEVIEHILEPEQAFRNIVDAIAPKGGAFITVPNGRIDTSTRHINFWSPESWQAFCKRNLKSGYMPYFHSIDRLQLAYIKREY